MSSSAAQSLVPHSSQPNPMLLMQHLLSVTKESDTDVQVEILKTSQAVSEFIEQMSGQFQMMAQRMAELESAALTASKQSLEAKKNARSADARYRATDCNHCVHKSRIERFKKRCELHQSQSCYLRNKTKPTHTYDHFIRS